MKTCTRLFHITSFLCSILFSDVTAQPSLSFGGTNAYVTFGANTILGLPQFTLEVWFMRTGTGVATSTGTGGTNAIPLIAKGRAEVDGDNRDMNYFLGIENATNVLVADFEDDITQPVPGLNHPVNGITPITNNIWHHAAATYDGTLWKLYLDGMLETLLTVNTLPQSASIQHASLASALNSNGTASGFFNGALDEARIWNYARTQTEIQSTINSQFNSLQTGLVAVWGLNEGAGTFINDSSSNAVNGTISGTNYTWLTSGAPFNLSFNVAPNQPTQFIPADSATCVFAPPALSVNVTDAEADSMTVTFYIAQQPPPAPPDFTIVGLPDTQYYTEESNGGSNEIFKSQTQWIVNNISARNIVFMEGLGDCVQNGDNNGNPVEWLRCDTALSIIENPITTQMIDGLPYGINVGNHDQSPAGVAGGTVLFNQYFGTARFAGRNYYGGNFGNDNNTNYCLFSASGMDFIVLNFEYDDNRDTAELNWAHNILNVYSNRRAIIASHHILDLNGNFASQGQLLYDEFKTHANVFMTMSGHVPGESSRQDTYLGNTIYSIMSDYQGRANGGDGWLRLYEFSPVNNTITVKTYSPWLSQWETDANSEFTISYNMTPPVNYQPIGTVSNVSSGNTAQIVAQSLLPATTYQWYVTVSDSGGTTTSAVYQFTTAAMLPVIFGNDTSICSGCTILLNAGAGYATYLWHNNSTDSTFTVTTTGTYFVEATDTIGCISADTINVTVLTGMESQIEENEIVIYPNPSRNELLVSSYLLLGQKEIEIKFFDVVGKEVFKNIIVQPTSPDGLGLKLQTSNLVEGFYFLEIRSQNKKNVARFVKIK